MNPKSTDCEADALTTTPPRRPSKVLPQRRADCHVSERVRDMNGVVVSRLPQRGDVRECALS